MTNQRKNTRPVRDGEEFRIDEVERFLREKIKNLPSDTMQVEQFSEGHSNLTYLIQIGDWEAVLRRPPIGPVAPKAHDMEREHRILSLIHRVFPLAPEPYAFCNNPSIMDAPFYVMERKKGIVIDRAWPVELSDTPEMKRHISEALVDTLVQLHAVDWKSAGLDAIGHPMGYMERQVEGWIKRYDLSKTDDVPVVEKTAKWLMEHLPVSLEPTVVHNDFKLNNMIFSEDGSGKVEALVDWEMTTIGDPLSDLAVAISYWNEAGDNELLQIGFSPVTAQPGFLNRHDLLELYAKKSGRDIHSIDFYMAFAYFKVAVICQQIYYRWKQGQTRDTRFERLGDVAVKLMERSHRIAIEGF